MSFAPLVPMAIYVNLEGQIHISLHEYGINKRHSKIITVDNELRKEINHYENRIGNEYFNCIRVYMTILIAFIW